MLRQRQFGVWHLSGPGLPDLLVAKDGRVWLVEVKQPKGGYKPLQIAFREAWQGPALITLRTIDEALRFPEMAQ